MKVNVRVMLVLIVLFFLAGCATTMSPRVMASQLMDGQERLAPDMNRGGGVLSKQVESVVSIEVSSNQGIARFGAPFTISVFNGGTEDVRFGPAQISATEGNKPLEILSKTKLAELQDREQSAASAGAVFGAVLMSLAQGRANAMQARAGNYVPSTSPSPAISQYVENVTKGLGMQASNAREVNEEYGKIELTEVNVMPLKTHGGFFVVANYSGTGLLILKVKVADEIHSFTFASK